MRHLILSAWAVTLCASIAGAQPARKEPAQYAVPERVSRVEARPPGIRLGLRKAREFALAPLSDPEVAVLAKPDPRLRQGVHRRLPPNVLSNGAWEVTSDGQRVWRMALHSPGSTAMRLEFQNFSAGSGKVWLHDGVNTAGPYTGTGLYDDGHFWSGSVASNSVTVEYEPGPGAPSDGLPPFEIRTVAHRVPPALRGAAAARAMTDAGTPDPADYCHLDPNCYPDWKGAMSMVAELSFEEDGAEVACSGALVSTRDNSFKPYLLTAGHCIHSEAAARTLEAYWSYQTASCGGTPPANKDGSTKSTLGAHLLDYGTLEQGDYSLVLLKDVPNNVTFSGWDPGDPPFLTEVTGIHHPVASWKRISFGQRVGDQTVVVEDSTAPGKLYFDVLWSKGRTEPGSSGSPLFSSPGVIVGTLTYGPYSPTESACQINPSIDGYGRFSNAYQYLKDYLENLPAATVTPDKTSLQFAVSNRAAPAGQTVRLTTQAGGAVAYKLRADASWLQVSTVTGSLSASAAAQVVVTVDPSQFDQPGQYSSTVTILSGTAAPQFINVKTTVTVDQSNVVASITPNPIQQSNGQFSFKIRLAETAGTATHVTAMKVNGTDYSGNIQGWFGTDQIASKAFIEAALQGSGVFPAGTQYFEFWGVDDASGRHWYRVTTANFQ